MPAPETAGRHQKAVCWERVGTNEAGEPIVTDVAVELDVTWVKGRSEALDPNGQTIAVDAKVAVDRKIVIGSIMWLGELADLPPGTSFQDEDEELMSVATYNEAPDLKGRDYRREVGLQKFRNVLPEST